MYNFRQVGGTHVTGLSTTMINIFIIIGFSMLIFGIFLLIVSHFAESGSDGSQISGFIGGFFTILPIFIVIILLANHFIFAREYHFYEGKFKIVQSDADKIDTTDYEDRKITVEDKNGNQQKLNVEIDDGIFKKGKLVYIKVKAFENDIKPTLKKPIESISGYDNNTKSIVKIKQVN